ncbi:UNVERIFIED_CONTAM: hypothetical protein GTU68_025462 [Idotea baltica]|nr:hypothetical protein [Idotea baltica]
MRKTLSIEILNQKIYY